MLHNPYYAGIVPYNGVYHQGTHEPLITVETWLRIQDVLAAHNLSGEKDRKHPHYLKGTVFCRECGGRLIFSRNKGHGGTYDYFFCLNRRTHRARCTRGGIRVSLVEIAVEDFYGTFQLAERDVEQLREAVKLEIQADRAHAEEDQAHARRQLGKLRDQQAKLLQAHYADAVPLDLMKVEMDRLTRGVADAEREFAVSSTALEQLDAPRASAQGHSKLRA
jgi:site-specific DNA recombinase